MQAKNCKVEPNPTKLGFFMANSSIWDTIRSIHSVPVSEPSIDSVDALSKELEDKLKSRHSGISGALVFIYDWLTQNNTKIKEAIGTIKEKKSLF